MRLIDADALKGEIQLVEESIIAADSEWLKGYVTGLTAAREAVVAAPTVDVVEVVRCKDCIHWSDDCGIEDRVCLKIYSDGAVSQCAWQERKPDDFCSYGERKDND